MSCLETDNLLDFNKSLMRTGCNKCNLANLVRTKVVISRGNPFSKILIVGQNPGAEEDKNGQPFIGPAGKLLDQMFKAIKIDTNRDCYLTNAVLCWTPNNDNPTQYPGVLETCRPYLKKQTNLLKPKIIIAVGKPAMESLTGKPVKSWLKQICGSLHIVDDIPTFPIMHPAYILRNQSAKPEAWRHLKILSEQIESLGAKSNYRKVV